MKPKYIVTSNAYMNIELEPSGNPSAPVRVTIREQVGAASDLRELAGFLTDKANELDDVAITPVPITKPPVVEPMTPQDHCVLKHLRVRRSITRVEAEAVHRVRHLPGCIFRIRGAGHTVSTEYHEDPTGQRYARYTLV